MKKTAELVKGLRSSQAGSMLLEVLLGLWILGFVAAAFMAGLFTESKATIVGREQATAESLARSQAELVKSSTFDAAGAYSIVTVPDGWGVSCTGVPSLGEDGKPRADLQTVTVTVTHEGKTILTLNAYKANRP